ncbi:hypothetical protein BGX23_011638 [Mortierella sp. AD031]|nr:hypothetical protein BGX23_011638 [Mortierella sp. AD031]
MLSKLRPTRALSNQQRNRDNSHLHLWITNVSPQKQAQPQQSQPQQPQTPLQQPQLQPQASQSAVSKARKADADGRGNGRAKAADGAEGTEAAQTSSDAAIYAGSAATGTRVIKQEEAEARRLVSSKEATIVDVGEDAGDSDRDSEGGETTEYDSDEYSDLEEDEEVTKQRFSEFAGQAVCGEPLERRILTSYWDALLGRLST